VLAPHGGIPALALAALTASALPVATAFIRWDDLAILVAGLPGPASIEKGR